MNGFIVKTIQTRLWVRSSWNFYKTFVTQSFEMGGPKRILAHSEFDVFIGLKLSFKN